MRLEKTGQGIENCGLLRCFSSHPAFVEKLGEQFSKFRTEGVCAVEVADCSSLIFVVGVPMIHAHLFPCCFFDVYTDEILDDLVVVEPNDAELTHSGG